MKKSVMRIIKFILIGIILNVTYIYANNIILKGKEINTLEDNPKKLEDYLKKYQQVILNIYDGSWTRNIILPKNVREDSEILIKVNSTWPINVKVNNYKLKMHSQSKKFVYKNGFWRDPSKVKSILLERKKLQALENNPKKLEDYLKKYQQVILNIYDGSWTKNIIFPKNVLEDSEILIKASSTWPTNVKVNNYTLEMHSQNKKFVYKNGFWIDWVEKRKPSIRIDRNKLYEISDYPNKLREYINQSKEVKIFIYNGSWIPEVVLPEEGVRENSKCTIQITSTHNALIRTSPRKIMDFTPGSEETYIYKNGKWIHRIPELILKDNVSIRSLENNPNKLKTYFKTIRTVHLKISDGVWTKNIVLPQDVERGSELIIDAYASSGVNVKNSTENLYIKKESRKFVFTYGFWETRKKSITLQGKIIPTLEKNPTALKQYLNNSEKVILNIYNNSWTKNIILPKTDIKEYTRLLIKAHSHRSVIVKTANHTYNLHKKDLELVYKYNRWINITDPIVVNYLNKNEIVNNITGDFEGMFKFAQTHTIFANGNEERNLPHLVKDRAALAIFIPKKSSKNSTYTLNVYDENDKKTVIPLKNPKFQPKVAKGDKKFISTIETPAVIYYENTWTAKIPGKLIHDGIQIEIEEKKNGTVIGSSNVDDIDVGAETEIIIYNIRLGMLTDYINLEKNPEVNDLEGSLTLAKDYFNKVPVSRLIIANYAPMKLDKIVLPNGKVYTEKSDDIGGDSYGDMRGFIAKLLVSDGINNANFGVNSFITTESGNHFANVITAHRAVGSYQNGNKIYHGFSGGNGMVTLFGNTGNEFSHELGHNYYVGHFAGGPKNFIQSKRSGWGYDIFKNIFIPNFYWARANHNQSSFLNYIYSSDTMSGGSPTSKESKYTLHTGYTQKLIQNTLEETGIFSSSSKTGYKIWDKNTKKMVTKNGKYLRKALKYHTPVKTILGYYDPTGIKPTYVYPAFTSTNGNVFEAEYNNEKCYAKVKFKNNEIKKYGLISTEKKLSNKVHINLDSSKNPTSVSIICKINGVDKILHTRKINNNPIHVEKDYIISAY